MLLHWMSADRSDAALLEAWRAGDAPAGNLLVRRHFASVYRFLWNKIDEQSLDDVVQATFLACVSARDRLRDDDAFRSYVLGIARLELLKHLRKRGRHDRAMIVRERQPATSVISPSGQVVRHQEHRLLLEALRAIPLDLQIVLELYYWEALPVAQVADVLDVPAGTVKSRLSRAREALREQIGKLAADPAVRESTLTALDRWATSLRELLDAPLPDDS
jgi:RNA polymerase sigma-70 factor (ECF subfamily)